MDSPGYLQGVLAGNETAPNRIAIHNHDYGNGGGGLLGRTRISQTSRNDDIHLHTHQLSRERGEAIAVSVRASVRAAGLNDYIFPFDVTEFTQTLPE